MGLRDATCNGRIAFKDSANFHRVIALRGAVEQHDLAGVAMRALLADRTHGGE